MHRETDVVFFFVLQYFCNVSYRMFYGPGGPYALFAGKDASRALAKMSFEEKDLTGDISGLGPFELDALQDWEYKFMSKYVKVGTIKTTAVPVTEPESTGEPSESTAEPSESTPRSVGEPSESTPHDADSSKPHESHADDASKPHENHDADSSKVHENHDDLSSKPHENDISETATVKVDETSASNVDADKEK